MVNFLLFAFQMKIKQLVIWVIWIWWIVFSLFSNFQLLVSILVIVILWMLFFPIHWKDASFIRKKIDFALLQKDVLEHKMSVFNALLLINQYRFFPLFSFLYLFSLFIKQTHFLDLQFSMWYLVTNDLFLLFATLCTWILFSFWKEDDFKSYIKINNSVIMWLLFMILTLLLWVITTVIIWKHLAEIWVIGILISILSWIIILLLWLLIYKENDIK